MALQNARAFAQAGGDRNLDVQERIRRRKAVAVGQTRVKRAYEQRPQQQAAKAFGAAAAAAQRTAQARESRSAGQGIGTASLAAQGSPGIGGAVNTAIGSQLQRRVQSGAIDPQQAKRVAGERALLEAKFGPDFREKVFGGTGAFQKARTQLAANPGDDRLQAILDKLKAKRKTAVSQARFARDRNSYTRFKQGASEGQ